MNCISKNVIKIEDIIKLLYEKCNLSVYGFNDYDSFDIVYSNDIYYVRYYFNNNVWGIYKLYNFKELLQFSSKGFKNYLFDGDTLKIWY